MPEKTNGEAPRSEDDILVQAPVRVALGGRRWEIQPLTILEQRKWRESFFRLFEETAKEFLPKQKPQGWLARFRSRDESEEFLSALRMGFLRFPEKVADAFFSYAVALPREEIEAKATETELVIAFLKVWEVAFPFLPMLREALQASKVASSLSEKSTS